MYFFDLPGFHPINGVNTDDHGKYPYLHFKDTIFEKDGTNYIDSYFPFKNIAIAEGKTVFISEKNLIAVFKYDPVFRDDLLIDHLRAVSKEQLNVIKEDFYKGYLAGFSDFPRQIQSTINLRDSPVKEVKLRSFIEFCSHHLFFEGFATPNCLYALGFIQAYLLKAFGEYQNLIQNIDQSLPEKKFDKDISQDMALSEAVREEEISETQLPKGNIPENFVPAEPLNNDGAPKVNLEENILEDLTVAEAVQKDEKQSPDKPDENVLEERPLTTEAVQEDGIPEPDLAEENKPESALAVAIEQDEKFKSDIIEEVTDEVEEIMNVSARFPKNEVQRERWSKIPLDYPTDEIISLWMILLEVWKCKPINSIQVFFEPEEVLDLLGSIFDDSANKRMLPRSEHKFFDLPPGKYDRIINLLMHATYKFNTDRNNINLEKYCEALIETFSCYRKTKVASLKSNINKERGNITKSIKSLPDSIYKNDFFKVLEKINEFRN